MEAHLDPGNYDGCDCLQRPCLYKQFGCSFKGTTRQLNQHENSSRGLHAYLLKMVQNYIATFIITCYNFVLPYYPQKSSSKSIILQGSVFKQIHDCKYQILKQLYNIESTMKHNVNSDALVHERLSEVKELILNNGRDCHVLNKLTEIERAVEVNNSNILKIQNTQNELKRRLCGNNQFSRIYNSLKPSYSCICEFKISNLMYHVIAAKNGQPYSTEEVHLGYRNSSITLLIYLNGEKDKQSWGKYISVSLLIKGGFNCPHRSPVMVCLMYDDEIHTHYQMTRECTCGLAIKHSTVLNCPFFAPIGILDNAKFVQDNSLCLLCFM